MKALVALLMGLVVLIPVTVTVTLWVLGLIWIVSTFGLVGYILYISATVLVPCGYLLGKTLLDTKLARAMTEAFYRWRFDFRRR